MRMWLIALALTTSATPALAQAWGGGGTGVDATARSNAATALTAAQAAASLASPHFTGAPTAPTQTTGDNTTDVATDAFVQTAVGSGGSGGISASGGNASATVVVSPTGTSRTMASRAADIFNVRDYGALGTGNQVSLSSAFGGTVTASLATFAGQSINGATPYSWMTNSAYGLTFSMATSVAQGAAGTGLTFLETLSGINNWSATVATWQDPLHGNYLVKPGMLVSGSCIAGGTTVSSVDRTVGDANYGVITLSQATSAACASGTSITFTIAPSQLAALSTDWLGIQSAMAAAWSQGNSGGSVYLPAGNYVPNASLINPGGIVNTGTQAPNIEFRGDGQNETRLTWATDLGSDECGILSGGRGVGYSSSSVYHDFRVIGPNYSRTIGSFPNGMDGLCLGENDRAYQFRADNMRAGVNGVKDHWILDHVTLSNNGYGIYFAPYSSTIGNQAIDDSVLVGNTIASIALSRTNQFDSSTMKNVHTGFGPYGFYLEAQPSNTTNPLGFLTNDLFQNVWSEAIGNAWIYGAGETGGVTSDTFLGGGILGVGASSYAIGGSSSAVAGIYVGEFQYNTLLGTNWGTYAAVTDAIVESGDRCNGNTWTNDWAFIFNGVTAIPPMKCGNEYQNRFYTSQGNGFFKVMGGGGTLAAGALLYDAASNLAIPYADGKDFIGVAASPTTNNNIMAVVTEADFIVLPKANSAQSISNGQPVFATGGGVMGSTDLRDAIGTAYGSGAGTTTVYVDLDPSAKGGSLGAVTGKTAVGTTQATGFAIASATTQFTTVASGSGATLSIIPVGESATIYNDGANALLVYPQSGGTISGAAQNTAVSVAAGSSAVFRRISTTLWHM